MHECKSKSCEFTILIIQLKVAAKSSWFSHDEN